MRLIRCFAALSLLALGCTTGARHTPVSDEVIYAGGTVAAGPTQSPRPNQAVYVSGGIVREVGDSTAIRAKYPQTRVVDTSGATVLPGLTDAHGHLYGLGLSLDIVSLVGTTSMDEIVGRVKERSTRASAGEWVQGRGWDQNHWPIKEFPTAAQVDAAVADHPVWLKRIDGHAGLANTAALRAAGITAATQDPAGGRIIRDASGNPTGVFIDAAQELVESRIPPVSHELRKQRVLAAAKAIAANGLTEMHDAGADGDTIRAVQELIDERRFPIRVYIMVGDNGPLLHEWFSRGPLVDYGGRLTVRSVKLYADGALGSRGAALLAPYNDELGNTGLVIATPEHIADVAMRAIPGGFQVNTHAIGDRGVRNVIDAYEKAGVTPDKRFRIEHFQVVAPDDFARAARDGIIASMQPTHATSDMGWAEARVGPERIRGAYAWRTVLDSGAHLALGSDFPVEDVNPWFGIYSAVTRQDHEGNPPGGWYPTQRLTLPEAIRGFTADAAYAAFEEATRGTIEPGKLADFTIVEGELYSTPASELWKTRVRMTVVGGEIVYRR
jgi:predicted amidohydrolase YtcJ